VSLFITLEGPDGGGKSTQAKELAAHLRREGVDVLLTREPGGTPIGDQIRGILMSLDNAGMIPRAEFLLFSASRAQLVHQVIRPHLDKGGVVVCDRFYDSSLAYQGYGHGLDRETLRTVTAFATGGLKPDLTLLLDLPVESGLGRRREAGHWNRLDDYDLEFHRRLRDGYQRMAGEEPERWVVIDATRSMEEVQAEIRSIVAGRLA
jgi:dTMP kinase